MSRHLVAEADAEVLLLPVAEPLEDLPHDDHLLLLEGEAGDGGGRGPFLAEGSLMDQETNEAWGCRILFQNQSQQKYLYEVYMCMGAHRKSPWAETENYVQRK